MKQRQPAMISFVIPVRNDAARLHRCLQSIRTAEYPRDLVEIIVVDDGSEDGSGDVARAAGATVIRAQHTRAGGLRNLGARHARGTVLAFVDADHEIDPGWLRHAAGILAMPQVGGTGAPCHAPEGGTWVQRMYDALRGRASGQHDVEWLGSGNMAVKRAVFERLDGFDVDLETCEDVDLCRRLRAAGFRLVSDERLRNVHYGDPATLRALFAGELWRGRENLRVSLRPPLTLRGIPSVAIPVVNLLAIVAVVAGAMAVPLSGPALPLAAIGVITGLCCLRSIRMIANLGRLRPLEACQAFAVAATYDVARALALLLRAGHDARRSMAAVPIGAAK